MSWRAPSKTVPTPWADLSLEPIWSVRRLRSQERAEEEPQTAGAVSL